MSTTRKLGATWEPDSESAVVFVGTSIYVLRVRSESNANGTTWSFTCSTSLGEAKGWGANLPTRRRAKAAALQHLEEITQ